MAARPATAPGRAHRREPAGCSPPRASARSGRWRPRTRPLAGAHAQVDQCAACHARRTRLVEDAVAGAPSVRPVRPRQPAPRPLSRRRAAARSSSMALSSEPRTRRAWPAPTATTPPRPPARRRQRAVHRLPQPRPDRGPASPACRPRDYDAPAHHIHRGGGAGQPVRSTATCRAATTWSVPSPRPRHPAMPRPDLSAHRRPSTPALAATPTTALSGPAAAIEHHHGNPTFRPDYGGRSPPRAWARRRRGGASPRCPATPPWSAIVRASAIEQLVLARPRCAAGRRPARTLTGGAHERRGRLRAAVPRRKSALRSSPLLADPLRAVAHHHWRAARAGPCRNGARPELQGRQRRR